MGLSIRAYAIIGCKLDKSNCYETAKVKNFCAHSVVAGRFCEVCGKEQIASRQRLRTPLNNLESFNPLHDCFCLIESTSDHNALYFGVATCKATEHEDAGMVISESLSEIKER